jgi:hypothetical protein
LVVGGRRARPVVFEVGDTGLLLLELFGEQAAISLQGYPEVAEEKKPDGAEERNDRLVAVTLEESGVRDQEEKRGTPHHQEAGSDPAPEVDPVHAEDLDNQLVHGRVTSRTVAGLHARLRQGISGRSEAPRQSTAPGWAGK